MNHVRNNGFSHVPEELKRLEQWVLWKEELRNERLTKVPRTVRNQRADVSESATWTDFETVAERLALADFYSGLGFVFDASDPFCGIDLDACRDPDSGQIAPWAHRWIKKFDSYTEISPSETGVKIWIVGRNPRGRGGNVRVKEKAINGRKPGVEVYDQKRFFACTGQVLEETRGTIEPRQAVLNELVAEYWGVSEGRDSGTVIPTRNNALERCWLHVQEMPNAISGEGGHDATFAAACECFRFGLSDREALEVMRRFNEQKTGGEHWNLRELEHKLTDAEKRVRADGQFGIRDSQNSALQNRKTFGSNMDKTDAESRTRILLGKDEARVNDEAVRALKGDPGVFQRGGDLVQVITDGSMWQDGVIRARSQPRIAPLAEITIRERLTRLAVFFEEQRRGKETVEVEVRPPTWCYKAIHQRGTWEGIPRLRGLASHPFLLEDGTVVKQSGFDSRSGVFCVFDENIHVPDAPSQHDAETAANRLLDVVCDFPFASLVHRAAWLACLLTLLARFAFAGPAPLFLFDANVRASGKSLLADLISRLVYGSDVARMANPRNDEEARKRITALALAGDPMVLIDNVTGKLGCAALDAALTSTTWKDRVLGASLIVELPLCVTWLATGNNVMFQADTARRVLHIRLDSEQEKPEEREDFKYPDIRQHVDENRPELLVAALTVLSAYCRAGRPRQDAKPWGSFEGWSRLVREAVIWAGQPDPGLTRQELVDNADHEWMALKDLLDSWHEIDPYGAGITTREIVAKLDASAHECPSFRAAILELCPPKHGDLPNTSQLGNQFSHVRRRVVNRKKLDYTEGSGRKRKWVVKEVNSPGGDSGDAGDTGFAPSTLTAT